MSGTSTNLDKPRAVAVDDNPRAPNQIDKTLGANIRLRRLEINMSQETLAEKIGITFQQIQKYEKGANRVSASKLYAIAIALGCSIAQLMGNVTTAGASEVLEPGGDFTRLQLAYSKLSPAKRTLLIRVAELFEAQEKEGGAG